MNCDLPDKMSKIYFLLHLYGDYYHDYDSYQGNAWQSYLKCGIYNQDKSHRNRTMSQSYSSFQKQDFDVVSDPILAVRFYVPLSLCNSTYKN